MTVKRRTFLQMTGATTAALSAPAVITTPAWAAREKELNILCWEGYNSDEVLDPFRRETGAKVSAESGTSDPDMINKLRAGEVNVWDVVNLNQPWGAQSDVSGRPHPAPAEGSVRALLREDDGRLPEGL